MYRACSPADSRSSRDASSTRPDPGTCLRSYYITLYHVIVYVYHNIISYHIIVYPII